MLSGASPAAAAVASAARGFWKMKATRRGRTILASQMGSRVLWRRIAAFAGIYSATILAFLGTVVAARQLTKQEFGVLTLALFTAAFLQSLLDLTVEEVAVKFGFRYIAAERWGRLRRLLRGALVVKVVGGAIATLVLLAFAPLAHVVFRGRQPDLTAALAIAALIPLFQAPEGLGAAALVLRRRYDVRGVFLAFTAVTRFLALWIGSRYGVVETVVGVVVAQLVSSAAISFAGASALRRFPQAAPESLADDRAEIKRFVVQSSLATTVLALRGNLGPVALGTVAPTAAVANFRAAQAPQSALSAFSAPARIVLLTEQTHAWEHGRRAEVFAGVRRYTLGAAGLGAVILVPALWLMPTLVRWVYTAKYVPATDAFRLVLVAGIVQLVVGWSKSLPVTIGRPGLRVLTHGIEVLVFVPLVLVLGWHWGATGAAAAVLASSVAFALTWAVLIVGIRRESLAVVPVSGLSG